jgi:hypothetical protein
MPLVVVGFAGVIAPATSADTTVTVGDAGEVAVCTGDSLSVTLSSKEYVLSAVSLFELMSQVTEPEAWFEPLLVLHCVAGT